MNRFNRFVCTLALILSSISTTAYAEGGTGDWQTLPPRRPVETSQAELAGINSVEEEVVKFNSAELEQEDRALANDSWLDSAITELARLVSF